MSKKFRTKTEIDQYYAKEYNKIIKGIIEGKIPSQQLLTQEAALFKECEEAFGRLPENQKKGGQLKISRHQSEQAFGIREVTGRAEIASIKNKQIRRYAKQHNITTMGFGNLPGNENKAIRTLNKILSRNDYKNNYNGIYLYFTQDEYLEEWGLKKYNYRGVMRYSSAGREIALNSLWDLAGRHILTKYTPWNPKKENRNYIVQASAVIKEINYLYGEPWEKKSWKQKSSAVEDTAEAKYIVVELCEVFLSEIDKQYSLISENLPEEIKEAGFSRNKFLKPLIDWLGYIVSGRKLARQTDYSIKIGIENLEIILQMEYLFKVNRIKRAYKYLMQTLEHAEILGYLDDCKEKNGILKLFINVEKFENQPRIIEVECEDVEAEIFIKRMLEWNAENPIKPFESTLVKLMRQAIEKSGLEKIKRIPSQVDSFWEFYCRIKEVIQPKKIEDKAISGKTYRRA
jgi:hypothetical protein